MTPFRGRTDGLVSVHVANLTVVVRLRGAVCRLPAFPVENTAQLSGEQPGKNSPEKIPSTGKDCNPQPANCLKDQYVLRHCCVYDRTGKTGHSAHLLVLAKFNTENGNIIPCEPCYSKLTFTIYHPVTHSFFTFARRLV